MITATIRDYPVIIPYQVDFQTTTVGKHIRQTKRHVIWRFGFSHIPSVLAGKKGVACRGMEIEVTLVWSIASGKHLLYLNNGLVYQSAPSSGLKVIPTSKFEHTFNVPENVIPGGHVIHIIAWAMGTGSHSTLDKQFKLFFDGQSYNNFCPIYLLGSPRMMMKNEIALNKAKEKLRRISEGGGNDDFGSQNSPIDPPGANMGDRPRWTNNTIQGGYNGGRDQIRPNMPLPPRGSSFHEMKSGIGYAQRRPSAPDLLSREFAKSDEEENIMLAQARINSFRDLRAEQERARSGMYPQSEREQEKFVAQAKVNSFRDMSGDHMSIPSFARPPASPIHRAPPARNPLNLQSVQEGIDLLDVNPRPDVGRGMVRSSSNVTLDTAIQSPDDDLLSLATDYSHLNPNPSWQTQQNISFRLQRPPVYADTAAGDLIQPSPSMSNQSFYGNISGQSVDGFGRQAPPVQPMNFAGRHMSYSQQEQRQQQQQQQQQQQIPQRQQYVHQQQATNPTQQSQQQSVGPQFSSNMSFTAAPPPTFESLNAAFAPSPSVAGN
jgi:hypothetical protein